MTKLRLIVLSLAIAFILGACSPSGEPSDEDASQNTVEVAQEVPTNTAEPTATETSTAVPTETAAPTETATVAPSPTPVPSPTPEEIVASTDACLNCHLDKEQLIETAAPEEKAPSESSGVG
jgi:PBP1b-binding outer membrane lipoprotein LpoB